jgi:hypothetical protein
MGRLSEAETFDRNKFIIDRIKMGLSRVSIERDFAAKFGLGDTQTRLAYQTANDSLIVVDPNHTANTRAGLLEILHNQLVDTNRDIAKISQEIDLILETRSTRSNIEVQLAGSIDKDEIARLKIELKSLPVHRSKYLLSCLDQRSRFRGLIIKFVTEIARLNGLYVEELPILRAIQIMANSELIPAETASGLLSLLGNLETQIDKLPAPANKGRAVVTDMN